MEMMSICLYGEHLAEKRDTSPVPREPMDEQIQISTETHQELLFLHLQVEIQLSTISMGKSRIVTQSSLPLYKPKPNHGNQTMVVTTVS